MDEFDFSNYSSDPADYGSVGDFNAGNFSLADLGNLDMSAFTGGGMDTGGFDFELGDILAELGAMGTDLGPSSSMGMGQGLLNDIGLGDLGSTGDPMDFGGTFQENMTRGQDGDPMDFGGTAAENIGRASGSTTNANYTTDAKGNVYKNGTLYRAADEVIDPKDDPYKKISTGDVNGKITNLGGGTKLNPDGTKKTGMDPMSMLMLMLMLSQMGKGGGSSQASTIPALTANRSALPYTAPSRPGAGGKTYFSPTTYAPRMAGGGEVVMAGGGIASLGSYSDGGQLLKGPGDGVSDSIPATIGKRQPARLADGEFVVPARIVSELGNGSTEAGARQLYAMMKRIEKTRKGAKDIAANTKSTRHLPA